MRFIHTADLHLGRKLSQISLARDFGHVLDQLGRLATEVGASAIVVAGDIYDSSNATEEAMRQWDRFITDMAKAGMQVVAVSGNHDSGTRLSVASGLISRVGIHIAGSLQASFEPVVVDGVSFWLIPFVRPADVRVWAAEVGIDASPVVDYGTAMRLVLDYVRSLQAYGERPNVCVAHQFVTNAGTEPVRSESEHLSLGVGGIDNVDYTVFDGFDYVALGHLHAPQRVGRDTCRYAGSPLRLSTSEAMQEKSFAVVDVKDGEVTIELRPVEPLRTLRRERGTVADLIAAASQESDERRQDFVHAVVLDDDPVDVVGKLRHVWPNLVQVTFDNAITRAAGVEVAPQEADLSKGMEDLFREFFAAQAGAELDEYELSLVREAFERAQVREGGMA